jgi:hypothetical protein
MRYLFATAFVCLVWHASSALAYSFNDNHYVNSSGTWCIRRPAVMSTRSVPRSAAMAASAFQSTTVGRARITVASPTGIAGMDGGLSLPYDWRAPAARRASKPSLIGPHQSGPRQLQVRTNA